MADSLTNILASPSDRFSVFEANQVLTSAHLNSLAAYVNYQEHVARTRLTGVGILGGLNVTLSGDAAIVVGRGVGVTTDGDLLTLAVDTRYDRFKPYGAAAPRYAPFFAGDTLREIVELVPVGQPDDAATSLNAFQGTLGEMVVVMLMERYVDDPDLCTGPDCDNHGRASIDTPRVLLVSRGDAAALATVPATTSQAALKLPVAAAARPAFSTRMLTTSALAAAFRAACNNTHATLVGILDDLHAALPDFTRQLFGGDPTVAWKTLLEQRREAFAGSRDQGIQYYYDFLKDVVDTWNELREALLDDDSVLCPDVAAFPRHLLLGDLKNPVESRTGWFPAPLAARRREPLDHARFLARKLDAQLHLSTVADAAPDIRVTPSYGEAATLEERSIPWYYPAAIRESWNHARTRRNDTSRILGYQVGGADVFGRQIARFDFFRIEGHLGKNVADAKAAIEKLAVANNLPFVVRAVLLHNDRRKIVVRPPIRFGDLHRFHQLLRKELTVQLTEANKFNDAFREQLNAGVASKEIPSNRLPDIAKSAGVTAAANNVAPLLAAPRFTDYQKARDVQDWRDGFKEVIRVTSDFRAKFGDVTHNNHVTAFDSLLTNNQPAWLEWLEALIQARDDQEDDKLLFPSFCQQHSGLEHLGGVARGGTFVLIYDDQGKVVADFALAYDWAETADDEPQTAPVLVDPRYKLQNPELFTSSVKVVPPLNAAVDQRFVDFESKLKGTLLKDQFDSQNKQLDYLKQFVQVIGSKSTAAVGPIDPRREFTDPLLRSLVDELDFKRRLVEDLQNIVADPLTPPDVQKRTRGELERVEFELAESVRRSTAFLTDTGLKIEAGSDGGKAVMAISDSVAKIGGVKAQSVLREVSAGARVPPQIKQVFTLRGL